MIAPSLQIRDMGDLNPFHTVAAGKKVCIVAKIPHFLGKPDPGVEEKRLRRTSIAQKKCATPRGNFG
jgi:hypothetical protein